MNETTVIVEWRWPPLSRRAHLFPIRGAQSPVPRVAVYGRGMPDPGQPGMTSASATRLMIQARRGLSPPPRALGTWAWRPIHAGSTGLASAVV